MRAVRNLTTSRPRGKRGREENEIKVKNGRRKRRKSWDIGVTGGLFARPFSAWPSLTVAVQGGTSTRTRGPFVAITWMANTLGPFGLSFHPGRI